MKIKTLQVSKPYKMVVVPTLLVFESPLVRCVSVCPSVSFFTKYTDITDTN